MKKAIAGLTALIAAAGISCARDAPVYSQREVVAQNETATIYKEVNWDSTYLRLTVRTVEDGQVTAETSYGRTEPADSYQCASIDLFNASPVTMEMPDGAILEGTWTKYFRDEGCDRTFEHGPNVFVSSDDPTVIEESTQQYWREEYDAYMQTITSTFGDVNEIIERWHEDKGL